MARSAHRLRWRGRVFRVSPKTSPVEHWSHDSDVTLPTSRWPENPSPVDNARQSARLPWIRSCRASVAFQLGTGLPDEHIRGAGAVGLVSVCGGGEWKRIGSAVPTVRRAHVVHAWRGKREPGGNPGLPRSGERERPPSTALDTLSGKRRPVGTPASGRSARESEDLPPVRAPAGARRIGGLVGGPLRRPRDPADPSARSRGERREHNSAGLPAHRCGPRTQTRRREVLGRQQ
jgi:hypothetical protein